MAIEISSIFSAQAGIERIVEQYMLLEERPLKVLLDKKDSLANRKSVLSSLDAKLSTLLTVVERMTDPITDYFAAKEATTSDLEKFTASAGASSNPGNHSITVDRLAISDTRVSQQYSDTDSTAFDAFESADQIFEIEVAHPTDADSSNRESISVTVSASLFDQDADDVLLAIASAINSAMSNAITAETIENDEVVHASVVTEESGKSRLVLSTGQSGYTYRMDFTDSADSLLASLEVNSGTQSSGTSGGWITSVGSSPSTSLLNAKFTLDGLTFYRDSNNVTDAITGVTLQLLDMFATTETVTITTDVDEVEKEVQDFLDAYNEVITFLRENTQYNSDTEKVGVLSNDLIYKDIINSLRGYTVDTVDGASSSTYTKLYNIGIEADDKGLLSIEDSEKFNDAVEANSTNISDLFNASDGIATLVKSYIDNFVKVGGTIDRTKNNIDSQVIHLEDRISLMDDLLDTKEAQLRKQFSRLQEAMIFLTQQQSFFGIFTQ